MDPGAVIALSIILRIGMAVGAGFIASRKGRSVAGWAVCGFIFHFIGLIIVACLSNVRDARARDAQIAAENRRLREQLQQERIKGESFRQHAQARLDAHDQHLGLDTRTAAAELPGAQGQGQYALAGAGPQGPVVEWYFDDGRSTHGPMPAEQIIGLVQQGRLPQTVLVWAEHMQGWQPMNTTPEFRNIGSA